MDDPPPVDHEYVNPPFPPDDTAVRIPFGNPQVASVTVPDNAIGGGSLMLSENKLIQLF